jgi:hypothetical protein
MAPWILPLLEPAEGFSWNLQEFGRRVPFDVPPGLRNVSPWVLVFEQGTADSHCERDPESAVAGSCVARCRTHWERDPESAVAGSCVARCRNHCPCLPLGARSGECGGWVMCGSVQNPLSLSATCHAASSAQLAH